MMGLDPKKMQQVMRQLGMKQEEIPAERVIIECSDKNIIIENPQVAKVTMQGQDTWQISGEASEIEKGISEQDITQVMEKAQVSREKAETALKNSKGDLAEAILSLS